MAGETQTTQGSVLERLSPRARLLRIVRRLWPGWMTGPIFDKELRVSSRRRRNYVLRFVYLALLTLFVVLIWVNVMPTSGRPADSATISRMSEAGKAITMTIVWFQFCATQILAVVMLSTSISDEIYHRTLGVLMTTPINSLQIVMGKLFSKLWQLLILVAVSFPVLAIIRVLGGVPWSYLISSMCITLTAVIFAGSFSLLFSIRRRRAYAVILKTFFVGAFLYAFMPYVLGALFIEVLDANEGLVASLLFLINPIATQGACTAMMFSPRGMPPGMFFSWPVHCLVMLGASALVLARAVQVVRKVALRQAVGQTDLFSRRKQKKTDAKAAQGQAVKEISQGPIRRVTGQPVVWKELKTPLLRGGRIRAIIGVVFTLLCLLVTYGLCLDELQYSETHTIYACVFVFLGLVSTAVLSATSITSEKESRSWPILLATPLSSGEIIMGKAIGSFRRCLPIWLLLGGHLIFFTLGGDIHPIVLLHAAMLVFWIVVFFTGSGLYLSSRFKRTTTAVVMNLALGLVLWLVIPLLSVLLWEMSPSRSPDAYTAEKTLLPNPMVQVFCAVDGGSGTNNARRPASRLDYDWPGRRLSTAKQTTRLMTANMVGYSMAGSLLLCLAWGRLRKNIF